MRAWDAGSDIVFHGALHLLIVASPEDGPSPLPDTLIALSYFELMARSMGLGTVWDGLAKWALTAILPHMPAKLTIPVSHISHLYGTGS